jgi:hypothetical protein
MKSRKTIKRTAIGALAGLAFGCIASTSLAAGRLGGPTVDNQGPAKDADGLDLALVLDTESVVGANDSAGSATPITAPGESPFAIRGALSKSEGDGLCRDVDFFAVTGLAPDTEHQVVQFGDINDKMTVGWFNGDGSLNSASDPASGKITVTSTAEGELLLACSADNDGDFDGAGDGGADPHGLCGDFFLVVDLKEMPVAGDVNGDSIVDVGDVRAMLGVFGETGHSPADLDGNGIVDADDVRIIADLVTDTKGQKLADKRVKKAEKDAQREAKRAAKRNRFASKEEAAAASVLLSAAPPEKGVADDAGARSRR